MKPNSILSGRESNPLNCAKSRVIVLGAGLLGLKIAHDLLDKGIGVTLVEQASHVGGLCSSFTVDGLTFDMGPHFYYTGHDQGQTAIEDEYQMLLGGELKSMGNYISQSLLLSQQGRYTYQPLRFGHIFRTFGMRYMASVGLQVLLNRFSGRNKKARSVKDLMVFKMGRIIWDDMFTSYIRKSSGIDPDCVDPLWVLERKNVLGKIGLLNLILLNLKRGRRLISGHSYPVSGGAHSLPSAYEKAIRAAGGEILLNSPVAKIHMRDGHVKGIAVSRNGREQVLHGEIYVSTLPLPNMIESIEPQPPCKVLDAARSLKFRGLALVCFSCPVHHSREHFPDAPQVYIGTDDIHFKRLSEPRRVCLSMGKQDMTGICTEVCCNPGDSIWNAKDQELYTLCRQGIAKMCPDVDTRLLEGVAVRRICHAYPIYPMAFAEQRARVLEYIGEVSNLLTKGRQGEFRYNMYTYDTFKCGAQSAEEIIKLLKSGQ
ncbi:MAG: NAD(P)-binding protein [Desulfobacterales bacterium]|nr:NAD(P)-binding protein [Desulfobacterales bacterium]